MITPCIPEIIKKKLIIIFLHNIRMKPARQNNNIKAINDVRTLLNELRNNLSREETKRIRKKLRRIEAVNYVLKEKDINAV